MKNKLLYLLLLLVILAVGCAKTHNDGLPASAIPSGTFAGQFKFYHRHTNQVPYDSLMANISVKLSSSDYTFTVTGDTATLHAGSYGTWGINSPYMIFNDKTYSSTAPITKTHLSGYYLYNYDGTNLILYASSSDTLILGYTLKKTTN